jgi:Na+-driven multidrug efflux pump
LGVQGIAYGNIIVNLVLTGYAVYLVQCEGLQIVGRHGNDFSWQKEWFRIGGISGIESFVRNAAFTLMIIRMINMVQQQGVFWVANNFIWGWLLLPILALGELIKRNTAVDRRSITTQLPAYLFLTCAVCVLWVASIPLWRPFIRTVMNVPDYLAVVDIVLLLLVYYMIFALNNIVDSIFYGLGRTDLMLYQSLIVNIFFYGGMFVAYRSGLFVPTLRAIALMFGIGMAIDSVITFTMFYLLRRRNREEYALLT